MHIEVRKAFSSDRSDLAICGILEFLRISMELLSWNLWRRYLEMIRKSLVILIILLSAQLGSAQNSPLENKEGAVSSLETALIGPNAVQIPLGKLLLVRKDNNYAAVKLIESRAAKRGAEEFARYKCFYQGDGSADFSKPNVQVSEGELSQSKPFGIGRFAFDFGNKDIRCGPIRLGWSGKGWVYFYSTKQEQGDYGVQLAPTNWNDISELNVFDPRLKWYKYDPKRTTVNIPLDQLWEGK
jgi:hypothetical protein